MRRLNGQRAAFEQRADELREKLLHTINALEQRRHTLLDVGYQVRRRAGGVVVFGVATALVAGAVAVVAVARARSRGERVRRERVRALARFWRHPDRVALGSSKPTVFREIGRKVLVGTIAFVAMQLIRRGVTLTLAPSVRTEPGRRALPATRLLPA